MDTLALLDMVAALAIVEIPRVAVRVWGDEIHVDCVDPYHAIVVEPDRSGCWVAHADEWDDRAREWERSTWSVSGDAPTVAAAVAAKYRTHA